MLIRPIYTLIDEDDDVIAKSITAESGYFDVVILEGTTEDVATKNQTTTYLKDSIANYLIYQPTYWDGDSYEVTNNYGFGHQALESNSGSNSNGFGQYALANNSGEFSSGFGHQALRINTGTRSTGVGAFALYGNTGAYSNGVGLYALNDNTGVSSSGIGYYALANNTGNNSNGIGYYALLNNSGSQSNGFGHLSLSDNTGEFSNGVGHEALKENTGARSNGFGYLALRNNTGPYSSGFGYYALTNNVGTNVNGVGYYALSNNSGSNSNGVGHYALLNNSGDQSNGVGHYALSGNTGDFSNGFGNYTLNDNTGARSNGFGYFALSSNTGIYSSGLGYYALRDNVGHFSNGVGYNVLELNAGDGANGFGNYALHSNCGDGVQGIGINALYYNQSADNIAIGDNAWATFLENTAGNKNFDFGDVDAGTDRITVTSHGFGSTNAYINLKYTEGTSPITGLVNDAIYQVKIIDASTIGFYEGSRGVNITDAGSGTGHTLTPQYSYWNTIVIGADVVPTASNQVILGNDSVTRTLLKGFVGIGADYPLSPLQVNSSSSTFGENLRLSNIDNTIGSGPRILFHADETPTQKMAKGGIAYARTNTYGRGDIHFLQNTVSNYSDTAIADSVMVIKNNGFVGIGTDTPDSTVHIQTTDASVGAPPTDRDDLIVESASSGGISILTADTSLAYLSFGNTSDTAAAALQWDYDGDTNGLLNIGTLKASAQLAFLTSSGVEQMRIDADGKVGIGTTDPKSSLDVVGLPIYADNAAAITGGLVAGSFYRTGADPDPINVVH